MRWREWLALGAVLLLILVFDITTLRQGHGWGDDFAMYIHHAENLALHRAYQDTGYIYNQREAWYGPRTYPPVFPLLLAPVIAVSGLDLQPMKLVEVAAFLLSLTVVYFLYRRDLRLELNLALLLILGFNPLLWDMKDSITSDFPFLLFFLVTVLLVERSPRNGRAGLIWGLLTGASLYLCYGTRSIGLMLLPGFAIYELIRYRKASWYSIVAATTAIILIGIQRAIFPATEGTYADQFHFSLKAMLTNTYQYASVLAVFWPWTVGRLVSYALFLTFALLAALGAYNRYRKRGLLPFGPLVVFYLLLIVIWPGNQGLRFLLPIVPAYLAYALMGLQVVGRRWPYSMQAGVLAMLLALIAGLYVGDFRKRDMAYINETVGRTSFRNLCTFLKTQTGRNDVVVCYRARALSLFTDRPASVYFLDGTPALYDEQWRYLRKIDAHYVIYSPLFPPDRQFLRPVLAQHSAELQQVFDDKDFVVYRIAKQP